MITQQTFNNIMNEYVLKDTYRYHLIETEEESERIIYSYLYFPPHKENDVDKEFDDIRNVVIAIFPPRTLFYNEKYVGDILFKYIGLTNDEASEFLIKWAKQNESETVTGVDGFF